MSSGIRRARNGIHEGEFMINDKNWQDSYLDRINIEFDKCLIELTDRSDRYRVIILSLIHI